jgi:Flp pilus assembly protein TadG
LWKLTLLGFFGFYLMPTKFIKHLDSTGATLIEVAITIPVFLGILLASVDVARVLYISANLNYSLHQTARWITTNDPATEIATAAALAKVPAAAKASCDQGCTRALEARQVLGAVMDKLGQDSSTVDFGVCRFRDIGTGPCIDTTNYNAGAANDYVKLEARAPVRTFFLGTTINLTSSLMVRNEPFS